MPDNEYSSSGDQSEFLGQVYSTSREQFETVQNFLQSETWDYFQFVETGLGQIRRVFPGGCDTDQTVVRDYYRHLDAQLGCILELLSDDTLVLVCSIQGTSSAGQVVRDNDDSAQLGFFVLVASNNPLTGEIEGTRLTDIAPTLLELGGYEIPDSMQGHSLVSGVTIDAATGLTTDEEDILRERLSGLGYIA